MRASAWVLVLNGQHSAGTATYLGERGPRGYGNRRRHVEKLEDAARFPTKRAAQGMLRGGGVHSLLSRHPTAYLLQLTPGMHSGYVEHLPAQSTTFREQHHPVSPVPSTTFHERLTPFVPRAKPGSKIQVGDLVRYKSGDEGTYVVVAIDRDQARLRSVETY